jgi:hypothetical protein
MVSFQRRIFQNPYRIYEKRESILYDLLFIVNIGVEIMKEFKYYLLVTLETSRKFRTIF